VLNPPLFTLSLHRHAQNRENRAFTESLSSARPLFLASPQLKVSRDGRPEVRLTQGQALKMKELAKGTRLFDYFLLALALDRGLRVGTITGERSDHWHWRKNLRTTGVPEKVHSVVNLPGIVLVHAKGGVVRKILLPKQLQAEIFDYATRFLKKGDHLVPIGEDQANNLIKKYGKLAGVPDWDRLHMHRSRHRFSGDYQKKVRHDWELSDLLLQTDPRSIKPYLEELQPEDEERLLNQ